jgi:hypothetical protein
MANRLVNSLQGSLKVRVLTETGIVKYGKKPIKEKATGELHENFFDYTDTYYAERRAKVLR